MALPPIWPMQPLANGKDTDLAHDPGTLPRMDETISGWFQLLVFEKITKTIVNYVVQEVTTQLKFQGVVITDPRRKLIQMPNGQRVWRVKSVYAFANAPLEPDDVVIYDGTQYRVQTSGNFRTYGYREYFLTQDYTGEGPAVTNP